jgi:hypothetical protein
MYEESKKTIKKYLEKQISISFTQDAWTAANVTAFMAVTAHFVDKNLQMQDLTLAAPHIEGKLFSALALLCLKFVVLKVCIVTKTLLKSSMRLLIDTWLWMYFIK